MSNDKSGAAAAYAAVDKAGIVQAIFVDMGDKGTADNVAEALKDGYSLMRTTVAVARTALFKPWDYSGYNAPFCHHPEKCGPQGRCLRERACND